MTDKSILRSRADIRINRKCSDSNQLEDELFHVNRLIQSLHGNDQEESTNQNHKLQIPRRHRTDCYHRTGFTTDAESSFK